MLKKARIVSMIVLAASVVVTAGLAVENLSWPAWPWAESGSGAEAGRPRMRRVRGPLPAKMTKRRGVNGETAVEI